ncbi:MAG: type II toxin-antitoxin system death-on-curing family toxin [Sneathiellales bacterium]|nr:type II toxin-antitoxin system death-on-curing family toxin [Sneathiellales bacterium]
MAVSLPSKNVIRSVHQKLSNRFELDAGMADEVKLGAALAWPRLMVSAENSSDVFDAAMSLMTGMMSEKPFAKGNKRLAFCLMVMTLRRNGWILDISNEESLRLMAALIMNNISEEKAADFIRRKSIPSS